MSKKATPQIATHDLSKIQTNTSDINAKAVALARHHGKGNAVGLLDPEEQAILDDLAILDEEVSDSVAERVILAQADGAASDAAPAGAGSVPSGSAATAGTAATGVAAGDSAAGSEPPADGLLLLGVVGALGMAAASGGGGGSSPPVDTTAPAAPVINPVATNNIINAAETGVAITGTAEANSTVTLTLGAGNTHAVTADAAGNWTYTLQPADITAMGQGAETISATAADAMGNVSAPGTRTITVDTLAPAVALTAATDDAGTVTGALASGDTTDDTLLALSGANEAGATVNVYNGATLLGAAMVTGTTWTYSATVADGVTYQFNAKATDAAGNTSAATANFTVIGDTTAPVVALTAATDDVGTVTGALVSGATTDDTALALSGTNEAGATVSVYNGATLLGAATVTGTTWTYSATVADGVTYQFNAKATDAAGNTSAATANFTVIGDTTAPAVTAAITAVADNVAPVVGNLGSGGATNDTSLDLSGTISVALGTGEVLAVYDGATKLGNATVALDNTWTYSDTTLANGDMVSYTLRAEDAAGNQGTASVAFTTLIDTVAPTATVAITQVLDNYGGIMGVLTSGVGTTDDTSLGLSGTITGTLAANDMVMVYDGATWLGAATVTGTTWTYTDTTLASGNATSYTVRVEDTAGNVGTASSPAFVATISAPTGIVTITSVADNAGTVQVNLVNGGTTDDTQPHLHGTVTGMTTGNVVGVWDGATRLGSATVPGDGTWAYLDNRVGLPDGYVANYTASEETLDLFVPPNATHRGTASNTFTTTIDLTAPLPIGGAHTEANLADSVGIVFNEAVAVTNTTGMTMLKNGTGAMTLGTATAGTTNITNDTVTVTTDAALTSADYVLMTYSGGGNITDAAGNALQPMQAVVDGSGSNTLDMSGFVPVYGLLYIAGNDGNDTITGTASADVIGGGNGADTVNGGGGADSFIFAQGDSMVVTYADVIADGMVNTSDTFTFAGGVADVINGAVAGSSIALGTNLSSVALPIITGQVGDQQYATVRGDYATGVFTVDTAAGADMMVVYDGDATAGVAQTALVLSGGAALALTQNVGQILIA